MRRRWRRVAASPRTLGFAALVRLVSAQRDRWILWLPAAAASGAAAWLAAPTDPPRWFALAGFAALAGAAVLIAAWPTRARNDVWEALRRVGAGMCLLGGFAALGAAAAEIRAAHVASPRLSAQLGPVIVEGWVDAVEAGEPRTRLRLLVHRIEGVAEPPRFVRVSTPGVRAFSAGRAIRCRAILRPPEGPLAPGFFDFARRAYFERLGGTGFTLGGCRPIALPAPAAWMDRARLWLAAVRSDMSEAIYAASPGPGGAVAASVVVGDRSHIPPDVNEALFNAGLGHILSVSGLHMSIAGGVVYAALATLAALIAPLALRLPAQKIAAAGALMTLTFYLLISGASVPAQRAYVMAAVALGAKLIDRPAISMRGLALAALIIVLATPDSVLEPGFQMSFAATAALVAVFEAWDKARKAAWPLPTPGPIVGSLQGIGRAIGGALLVSFVAGLATDPFALYHFQRFSVYGLPSNLAVAPLVSFVMAPAAALAAALAPFGQAEPALQVLAAACDLMVGIARAFGERPEALRALPKPPDAAFILAAFAIMWACLWRGALRWAGAPMFAGAAALYAFAERPVLLFDGEVRAIVAQREDAAWTLLRPYGRSTFARDRIGAAAGLSPARLNLIAPPEGCAEAAVCVLPLRGGARVAVVTAAAGFADSRLEGALVITRLRAPAGLRARAAAVIDADDIARRGGGFVYVKEGFVRLRRARGAARRPWTPP
ncbi:MAG: ComEC/Rec2 family competence protein [Hydrogenophilaceae bacterium]|nr:ComEC/Rec2 family competence protein [Hydrogenophilaceae bacterium]